MRSPTAERARRAWSRPTRKTKRREPDDEERDPPDRLERDLSADQAEHGREVEERDHDERERERVDEQRRASGAAAGPASRLRNARTHDPVRHSALMTTSWASSQPVARAVPRPRSRAGCRARSRRASCRPAGRRTPSHTRRATRARSNGRSSRPLGNARTTCRNTTPGTRSNAMPIVYGTARLAEERRRQEPAPPGQHHQDPEPALGPPPPGDDAGEDEAEDPPDLRARRAHRARGCGRSSAPGGPCTRRRPVRRARPPTARATWARERRLSHPAGRQRWWPYPAPVLNCGLRTDGTSQAQPRGNRRTRGGNGWKEAS